MKTAKTKDATIPILTGIKRDTKEILDIFAAGVTFRPSDADQSDKRRNAKDAPISITIKLEGDGKSFAETRKTTKAGRKSILPARISVPIVYAAPVDTQQPGDEKKPVEQPAAIQPAGIPVQHTLEMPPGEKPPTSHRLASPRGVKNPIEPNVPLPGNAQVPQSKVKTRKTGAAKQSAEAAPEESKRKRDSSGRFKKDGESKSQKAFEDKKQKDSRKESMPGEIIADGKAKTLLSKLLGAGAEVAKNTDAKEAVGLATLGPVAGAVSEMASLGGSVRDTVSGVVDKFRGDKKSKKPSSGDSASSSKIAEAQLESRQKTLDATTAVAEAVEESDNAQEKRHKQLVKTIKGIEGKTNKKIKAATGGSGKKERKPASKTATGNVLGKGNGGSSGGGFLEAAKSPILAGGVALAAGGIIGTWLNDKITDALDGVSIGERIFDMTHGIKTKGRPKGDKPETGKGPIANVLSASLKAEGEFTSAVMDLILGRKSPSIPARPEGKAESSDEKIKRIRDEVKAEKNKYSMYLDKVDKGVFTDKPLTEQQYHPGIGSLSERYESGGDPGAVNEKDVGGAAYGSYQMHSSGTVGTFVKNSKWAKDFEGLKPGSKAFSEKWKEVAARDGKEFGDAQHESIKQTHYAPMVQKAEELGIDVSSNKMLQDVLWSTGVQHGSSGGPAILSKALAGTDPKKIDPQEIVSRVYAERGRKDVNGNLVHFPRVKGAGAQQGISDRFVNERRDAMAMGFMADNVIAPSKISQPIEQILLPSDVDSPIRYQDADVSGSGMAQAPGNLQAAAEARQLAPSSVQPIPITMATSHQPAMPVPVPIVPPKQTPQQVVLAPSHGNQVSGSALAAPSHQQSAAQQPKRSQQQQQSQPQKTGSNIRTEFDDVLLTLMAHDLM